MGTTYIRPSNNTYTIYTKSNCKYCEKTKELLRDQEKAPLIINCDSYLQNDKEHFLQFIKTLTNKNHRTFPIVFVNGLFIGGYNETQQYHRLSSANSVTAGHQ